MKQLARVLAAAGLCAFTAALAPRPAVALETYEARMEASDAATRAAGDMFEAFGYRQLKPGQYLWRDVPDSAGPERVVISLSDQLAFVYRGNTLMAVSTISSGRDSKPTPTGVFSVLGKTPMYHSKKYDNAPMPFAMFFDPAGIALHAGYVGHSPNSHGCVHLPMPFAQKLYSVAPIGTPVVIGA